MALHPVGPLPASRYWLRRLLLLALLVVVVLVLRSCAAGGSVRHPSAATTPHPTPSSTRRATPAPGPTASATPRGIGPCLDSGLSLVVSTDAASYKVSGTSPAAVTVTMTVTNTSGAACTRDLGGDAVQVLVDSGSDRIWSNTDCTHDSSRNVVTLQARQVLQTTVVWSGHRSAPGCPTPQAAALPGTYTAHGLVGTLASSIAVFSLHT